MKQPLTCSSCHATYRVESVGVGQSFSCPKCQHSWIPIPLQAKPLPKKATLIVDAEKIAATSPEDSTRSKGKRAGKKLELSPLVLVGAVAAGIVVVATLSLMGWLVMRPVERIVPSEIAKTPNIQTLADSGGQSAPVAKPNERQSAPAKTPIVLPAAKPTREQIYQRLLRSTAFILTGERDGRGKVYLGAGSGSLVHLQRRLVLTNYHVVTKNDRVLVFFPAFEKNGELITQASEYEKQVKSLGISGKVIARNPTADLALIEIERVPDTVDVLPLAGSTAAVGAEVISIGASGINLSDFSGSLWRLSTGAVRGRVREVFEFPDQRIEGMFLETQKPINSGDSGGPTVNDAGELVGVVSLSRDLKNLQKVDLVKYDIDLTEVRDFLKSHAVKNGWVWTDPRPVHAGPSLLPPSREQQLRASLSQGNTEQRVATIRELAALKEAGRKWVPQLLELADQQDELVRSAVEVALGQIGEPLPDDGWCLSRALKAGGPIGRRYALQIYSNKLKIPADYLPSMIEALESGTTENRVVAAKVLGNYGGSGRKLTLSPLSLAALDADSAVADAAVEALARIGPYQGEHFRWLTDRLNSQNLGVKRFVITQIGIDAPDADTAVSLVRGHLGSPEPSIRTAAVTAIGCWGPKAIPHVPVERVLPLLNDVNDTTRMAAIVTVGKLQLRSALPKLHELAREADAREERAAAGDSLLQLDLLMDSEGLAALNELIGCESPAVRIKALNTLAGKTSITAAEMERTARSLTHDQTEVRIAALKVLAAVGEPSNGHAETIAKMVVDKDETLSALARETLVRIGPKGAEPLSRLLNQSAAESRRVEICQTLAKYGSKVPNGVAIQLMVVGENDKSLRSIIAEAAVAMNTDAVSEQLRKFTAWYYVGTNKLRRSLYTADCQMWAFDTIGQLDPNKLSEVERKRLLDGLKNQSDVDPDKTCRREASAALAKLKAKMNTSGK